METVLSDHPSLPSQACLLGSAGAVVLYGCSSLQYSKGCPSLVVECLLDQMQSWCSVWFQVAILGFIPCVWCGWKLLTASVSCARQRAQCPVSVLRGTCSSSFLVAVEKMWEGLEMQLYYNRYYWRNRRWLPRYIATTMQKDIVMNAFSCLHATMYCMRL